MKRILFSVFLLVASVASLWADGVHFEYDPGKYEQQTHVFAAFADNLGTRINDPYYTYYLGAFIGGECRYEAVQQMDPAGNTFFDLMVGGNASEVGQRITFRVYKVLDDPTGAPAEGTEYWLDESQYFTYNADDRTTDVSSPKLLTFMPVSTVMIDPEIRVYKGQTVDLTNYIIKESYETLPVITWDGSEQGGEYYTLEGNMLTAVEKTEMVGAPLIARWGGVGDEVRVNVFVDVMATSATWLEAYRSGITVPVGDEETIGNVLATGFTLTPADASTTFSWTSSNTEVVNFVDTRGLWLPLSKGTATLKGTANDESGLTLSLTVTVVQPVTDIRLSETEIYVEVGSDITDRLNELVNVYPENATNKEVTWRIDDGNTSITWLNNRFTATTITKDEDVKTMTVTAKDGYGASAELTINVIAQTPKTLSARQATLYLTHDTSNDTGEDCTADVLGNLELKPDGLTLSDYGPSFESSDNKVIEIEASPASADVTFRVKGSGEATITASISFSDYTEMDETGAPTICTLSTTFNIIVRDGLGSFTFDNVNMTREEAYTLVIAPQPAGSTYDASKISVAVKPFERISFPAEWTFVDVTPVADSEGLKYTLNAKSVGNGDIVVSYDGEEMGRGTINVGQRLHLADGWQWISLYEGSMNEADMRTAFGDKLSDLRSQDSYIINDSELGYFGNLASIDPVQTYKLRLKDVGSEGLTYTPQGNYYMTIANATEGQTLTLRKGWNWIGNPYQYYQTLTDVLAGNTFANGDWIKSKTGSATYNGTTWTGSLKYLTPGEGILLYIQSAGDIKLASEFTLTQQATAPLGARRSNSSVVPTPWTFDHSLFENNMAMVVRVSNVNDPSRITVWAFVGNECRGQGESVGDLQFITVHGVAGERVTFILYDELTGMFHDVYGSRTLTEVLGTYDQPVPLFAGQATDIDSIKAGKFGKSTSVYDLQGRRLNTTPAKGVYILNGRKVVR